jgi:transcriptional regulator with XRE-family HTH domain
VAASKKVLTESNVVEILQSVETNSQLAARFGVSRQAISQIRNGINWVNVAPELPRIPIRVKESVRKDYLAKRPNCQNCLEWNGHECSYGFPEAIDEPFFAVGCDLYRGNQGGPGSMP